MSNATVPVSERALIARINRKLPEHEKLKKLRGSRWENDLGQYYIIDQNMNAILHKHINVEELARELGAIKPWESLVADQ